MTVVVFALLCAAAPPDPAPENLILQALELKRVYVDKFSGGESASQLRDMVIAALQRSRLFVITENLERAAAVLRGSGEDLIFTDTFQQSDSVGADAGISLGRGTSSRSRDTASLRGGLRESDSTHIAERRHEATASIRLVNKEGDVIWSTTQESQGGKFRSASADVADKITRQLQQDLDQARERLRPHEALPAK